MASFLDFLKAGKKPELPADRDGCPQENLDTCCSLKGGIRPLSSSPSSLPSTPPPQPTGTFSDEGQGEGEELALSGCPSPCKPLDEELKGNLEALPSFSSDEEDSVSKNQDLQKSISSAISALYDTPHSLAAAMASAMMKAQPPLTPTTPQEPSLSPLLPARPPPIPDLKQTKEEILPCTPPRVKEDEEQKRMSSCSNGAETKETEHSDEEKTRGGQEEVIKEMLNLQEEEEPREEAQEEVPGMQTLQTPKAQGKDALSAHFCGSFQSNFVKLTFVWSLEQQRQAVTDALDSLTQFETELKPLNPSLHGTRPTYSSDRLVLEPTTLGSGFICCQLI